MSWYSVRKIYLNSRILRSITRLASSYSFLFIRFSSFFYPFFLPEKVPILSHLNIFQLCYFLFCSLYLNVLRFFAQNIEFFFYLYHPTRLDYHLLCPTFVLLPPFNLNYESGQVLISQEEFLDDPSYSTHSTKVTTLLGFLTSHWTL